MRWIALAFGLLVLLNCCQCNGRSLLHKPVQSSKIWVQQDNVPYSKMFIDGLKAAWRLVHSKYESLTARDCRERCSVTTEVNACATGSLAPCTEVQHSNHTCYASGGGGYRRACDDGYKWDAVSGGCFKGKFTPHAWFKPSVCLVHADTEDNCHNVKATLDATGAFGQVDCWNAFWEKHMPEVDQLREYDTVLAWSFQSFQNPNKMGDHLAEYWDVGGRVVVATFGHTTGEKWFIGGAWASGGYHLLSGREPQEVQPESGPLDITEPLSFLVANVTRLTSTRGFKTLGEPINGGVVVARWGTTGTPLIVRGMKNGRLLVAINMYPPSEEVNKGFWVGDGAAIMRNALMYR